MTIVERRSIDRVCARGGSVDFRLITFDAGCSAIELCIEGACESQPTEIVIMLGAEEIDSFRLALSRAVAHKNRGVERGEIQGWTRSVWGDAPPSS